MTNYYPWFKKVINFCIYCFFILSLLANLNVYTSVFSGYTKLIVFVVILVLFSIFIYLFRNKIKNILNNLIDKLSIIDYKKLLLIIILTSIILKVIYYIFFFFDSTLGGGDITIYDNIASTIVEEGLSSVQNNIYYLVGMGMHLSIFKFIGIPTHVGVYVVFLIATIINFISFKGIVGKEKAFLLIMLYLLMPSTSLWTFCVTHELFVYLYFSLFIVFYNKFIQTNEKKKIILFALILTLVITLNKMVSPIGTLWYIVLPIGILLSNIKLNKKIILLFVLVASLLISNVTTVGLKDNYPSQLNDIEQLIIGSSIENKGTHVDGTGKRAARKYWEARGVELTYDNLLEGEKGALIEQYKYLMSHPVDLVKLLSNKFFVAWSGDYYSIELGYAFGGITNNIAYYILLGLSGLLWLFVISVGVFFFDKNKKEDMNIMNYKLVLLGIVAVLLIVEIENKYSCYMTIFIYLIAFTRTGLNGGKENEKA